LLALLGAHHILHVGRIRVNRNVGSRFNFCQSINRSHCRISWTRDALEKLTCPQLVKKFPHFMEIVGSLPHSQAPATCPYPAPDRSSPCQQIPLPEDLSYTGSYHSMYRISYLFSIPYVVSKYQGPWHVSMLRDYASFNGEELSVRRPTTKLEDHSSNLRDCLFHTFAATLHIGGRSSIRNRRTHHAVVTATHLSRFP